MRWPLLRGVSFDAEVQTVQGVDAPRWGGRGVGMCLNGYVFLLSSLRVVAGVWAPHWGARPTFHDAPHRRPRPAGLAYPGGQPPTGAHKGEYRWVDSVVSAG